MREGVVANKMKTMSTQIATVVTHIRVSLASLDFVIRSVINVNGCYFFSKGHFIYVSVWMEVLFVDFIFQNL